MQAEDYDSAFQMYRDLVLIAAEYEGIPADCIRFTTHDGWQTCASYDLQANQHGEILVTFRLGLGWESVEHDWDNGFLEYATLQYLIPNPPPKGIQSIEWVATHEAAHMIDQWRTIQHDLNYMLGYIKTNGRFPDMTHDHAHGPEYIKVYQELIDILLSD